MATDNVGLFRSADHRYWWNGQPEGGWPGVTGILRVIDKPAIGVWAKRETAKCALRNWDLLDTMRREGGDDAAVAWLEKIPDYQKDTAGRLGSAVHRLAEMVGRGEEAIVTDEEQPFVDAYRRFLADYQPSWPTWGRGEVDSLEKAVINETEGYGGTLDLIFRLDGEVWLADIKTSRGTYAETALQLAAYANAEFVAIAGDPRKYRMPHIDRYAVLHLRPDAYQEGYRLIEYRVTDAEFRAFLAALRLSQWAKQAKPVGEAVARSFVNKRVPKEKVA